MVFPELFDVESSPRKLQTLRLEQHVVAYQRLALSGPIRGKLNDGQVQAVYPYLRMSRWRVTCTHVFFS